MFLSRTTEQHRSNILANSEQSFQNQEQRTLTDDDRNQLQFIEVYYINLNARISLELPCIPPFNAVSHGGYRAFHRSTQCHMAVPMQSTVQRSVTWRFPCIPPFNAVSHGGYRAFHRSTQCHMAVPVQSTVQRSVTWRLPRIPPFNTVSRGGQVESFRGKRRN